MPSITLLLNGDGVTTNWTDQSAGTTNLYQNIDEGTASPNDSDYIKTNVNDAFATFLLDNLPVDFISATSVAIKLRHNCTSSKSPIQVTQVSIVESDNTTFVAGPSVAASDMVITTYTYNPSVVTSANNKTTWDGARLKIVASGSNDAANVYAAQVDLVYSNVYVGSGGTLCNGTATSTVAKSNINGSGGTLCNGDVVPLRFFVPAVSGGVTIGGSTPVSFNNIGSGGVLCNGLSSSIFEVIVIGGTIVAGTLPMDGNMYQETGLGGAKAATSFAPRKLIYSPVISSAGVLIGGTIESISTGGAKIPTSFAPRSVNYYITGSGGILAGGDVMFPEIVNGGVTINGTLQSTAIFNVQTSGDILVAGTSNNFAIYTPVVVISGVLLNDTTPLMCNYVDTATGGTLAGGAAIFGNIFTESGAGGVQLAGVGVPVSILSQKSSGGVLIGGFTIHTVGMVGSSGVKVNGANSATIVYRNFTASGNVLCNGSAPLYIAYNHQPTSGSIVGGSAVVELSFKTSGGVQVSGAINNVAFMNFYPTSGVIIDGRTSVGVSTTMPTNTNSVSAKIGGSAEFFYSMVRALSSSECKQAIPCVSDEFEPKKPKLSKYISRYSTCKKTIILRGGFVPSTTVCTLGFKVKELINQNQDISKGPAQRTSEPTVEIS